MEDSAFIVSLPKNPQLSIRVIPGHFTTNNAHINYYLDVSQLKTNATLAKATARELAMPYLSETNIDTIVCMEKTEVIGAFLAEELIQYGAPALRNSKKLHIVTPIINTSGKLFFQSNMQEMIYDKDVILLVSTISSGRTVDSALECLSYYGGRLAGISALFRASSGESSHEVHELFTSYEVPGYKTFSPSDCDMCGKGHKLDAIVSSEGYTKM